MVGNETIAIAVLIPVLGVISPLLMAWLVNRNTKQQKQLDWDRQDKVAEMAQRVADKAEEAARYVVDHQVEIDKKTDHVLQHVAEIHGLVNGHYTNAIRSELAATRDTLALMSELIQNHKSAGVEPSIEVMAAYRGREEKIRELEATLMERELAVVDAPTKVIVVNQETIDVHDKGK